MEGGRRSIYSLRGRKGTWASAQHAVHTQTSVVQWLVRIRTSGSGRTSDISPRITWRWISGDGRSCGRRSSGGFILPIISLMWCGNGRPEGFGCPGARRCRMSGRCRTSGRSRRPRRLEGVGRPSFCFRMGGTRFPVSVRRPVPGTCRMSCLRRSSGGCRGSDVRRLPVVRSL